MEMKDISWGAATFVVIIKIAKVIMKPNTFKRWALLSLPSPLKMRDKKKVF